MTVLRRTVLLVLSAGLAVALSACGGGGASDEDQVREIAEQLAGEDPAVCRKLTPNLLERIGTVKECEESSGEGEGPKPTVEEVAVDGETATAVILDEDKSTLKLVKKDGEWLADDIVVEEGAGNQ